LAAQCREVGARVTLLAWPDHHGYPARDVERLLHVAAGVDYVVVTEKDAVKLETRWPAKATPVLVADLGVQWDTGGAVVERMVRSVAVGAQRAS
jgi:tetraacyldisaccharide-1-P 4'-kinase